MEVSKKMLFTSKGQIYHEFLQFAGATLHYSTGYAISIMYPDNYITPLHEHSIYNEPYNGYISKYLKHILHSEEMNKTHILYLEYSDAIIYYPIEHHGKYLGTIFIGPLKIKGVETHQKLLSKNDEHKYSEDQNDYLRSLSVVYQFQIQYLTNLLNLVINSKYFDPTVISTYSVSDKDVIIPPSHKLTSKISHHRIDQEEKIIQRILLSEESFKDLAFKNISKLSNLVAPPLADDPLRSEKNRFITAATIISRAAIKLGLPSDTAFSYSDHFIKKVEECNSIGEVWDMQLTLFSFYRKEVQKKRSGSDYNSITNTLLLYIDNHIAQSVPFQEVCTQLNVDYKYASNCFKKDIGLGFNKYFTNKKMEVAKQKLETTNMQIQEIAESLGYNNPYYFTRTFKTTFGVTPAEYRKQSIIHQ